jgi:uncharacterized surface protein with fasciclin (FAS1) repeats
MKKSFTINLKKGIIGLSLMLSTGSFAQTVYDVIAGSPDHTSLRAAIDAAGLDGALQLPTATYTVFAPDNAAFVDFADELGVTVADLLLLPTADLQAALLYHVLDTEVGAAGVINGLIATPLNPANTLKLTVDGSAVYVNQAQVNAADLQGSNGVVHSIDAVVVTNETVADVAIDSPAHTTLVAAVVEARLLPALTNPWSSLTVFAPTDDAFTAALTALGITAPDLLASPDLVDILLYHVVAGTVLSTDLTNGPVTALSGGTLTVDLTMGVMINNANVTTADLTAANGVVHVIDAVLLDPTASLEEINNVSISMYPNPASDFITIDSKENGNYVILDIMGAIVSEGYVSNNKVSISSLNNGTYIVKFSTESGVYQGRFIKN